MYNHWKYRCFVKQWIQLVWVIEVCGCKTKWTQWPGFGHRQKKSTPTIPIYNFQKVTKNRSLWCMGSHVIFCFFLFNYFFERLCSCNLGRKQIFDFEALAFSSSSSDFLFLRLVIGLDGIRMGFNGSVG